MRKSLAFGALVMQVLFPGWAFGLSAGDKAPPFEAVSTRGPVRLGDFLGKRNVVLAFYFRDFTPV